MEGGFKERKELLTWIRNSNCNYLGGRHGDEVVVNAHGRRTAPALRKGVLFFWGRE